MTRRNERRERELLSAREAVIDAAIGIFAEHGYSGATMEQLAAAAGYSVGSLYNYFSGKQALYRSMLQRIAGEVQAAIEIDLPESVGFFDALVWSVKRHFATMTRYRSLFRTAFEERASFDLGVGAEIVAIEDTVGQVWLERVVAMVKRGQERGEVRAGSPMTIAWIVTGVTSSLFHVWVLGQIDEDIEPTLRDAVDLLSQGLRAEKEAP